MKDAVLGIVRHIITTSGGALVTTGYVTQNDLTIIAGAGSVIVGIIWSIVEKRLRKA